MKRISIILAFLLGVVSMGIMPANAQSAKPNRVIIVDQAGGYKSHVTDNIAELKFINVPGIVKVYVDILDEVQVDFMVVSLIKSEACRSYVLAVVPQNIMNLLNNDAAVINYVAKNGSDRYYEDFTHGEMTGIDLNYSTDYSLVAVAYDDYGIPVGVTSKKFRTPTAQLEGNPYIDCQVVAVDKYSFSVEFNPNSAVGHYYACAFQKGAMESDFNNYGGMFNASNLNEFIVALCWDRYHEGTATVTWDDMNPSTDYEIAIAMTDVNGNFTPQPQMFYLSTEGSGGTGDAFVEVQIGDYVNADWDGVMRPSQYVTYVPNSQTARYRVEVYYAADYDLYGPMMEQDLCTEPPYSGIVGWWLYEPMDTDYPLDPSTEYVFLTAGQNLNNQWGKVNVVRYKTPDTVSRAAQRLSGTESKVSNSEPIRHERPKKPALVLPKKMGKEKITLK